MIKSVLEILNELSIGVHKETGDNYIVQCWRPGNHKNGDRKPSMSVHKEKGIFHCWACHHSGHIAKEYWEITGKSVSEKGYKRISYEHKSKKVKKSVNEIVMIDGRVDPVYLHEDAMKYLKSIGVYKNEFIDTYKIKFSKRSVWQAVHTKKDPMNFYNRIIIPVHDEKGNLINVEARDITGESSHKVLYPRDSISNTLFNIYNVVPEKPLVIVEGIKDLMKVWNVCPNVISMFNNMWTKPKIELLKKRGFTDNIILFIDNDKGGQDCADWFVEQWEYDFRVCQSPVEGQDPNDCSIELIKSLIENSVDYNKWLVDSMQEEKVFSW